MRLELKKRSKRNKKKVFAVSVIVLCVLVAAFYFLFFFRESEMLREVAQSELESIAYDIVGRIAEEEISGFEGDFDKLINIERDHNGKVSAITTDMQRINLIKLRIANRLSEEMFERTEDIIKIPLGNLTGVDYLTGLGPDVKFRVLWVSSVNSEFSTSLESAGINQTIHKIMLDFSINVGMMFVGREIGVDVGTSVCAAETVIVGEVPEYLFKKQ